MIFFTIPTSNKQTNFRRELRIQLCCNFAYRIDTGGNEREHSLQASEICQAYEELG